MARPGGLGRGLGALIPNDQGEEAQQASYRDIEVGLIEPRVYFDEELLSELADSVREVGVIQPVLVRSVENGRFQLIAGERRWRAARRAGLLSVPAIVRQTDDLASVEQALVENLHRQDLTALEEAAAYQQLIDDFRLTHDQIATRVGKSRSAVTNTLRLMNLPPSIQHLVADGRLSAGHARALLATSDRPFQERLARRAVHDGWSVRTVEDAVRDRLGKAPAGPAESGSEPLDAGSGTTDATKAATRLRPPGLLVLDELLADHLDTRVEVSMVGRKGKVAIEFADLDDLERIYRRMTEA